MPLQLSEDQVSLQKRIARNLSSAFDKDLDNAPVLSDFLGAEAINVNGTDLRSQRALLELLLDQAAGRWLDFWGYLFRLERKLDETDIPYRARIIKETIRPRMNELAIEDVLNDDDLTRYAKVFTPLTKVVFASQRGTMSTGWHIADGRYWHGCVIDIESDNYNSMLDYLVSKNRAAGILAWLSTRVSQLLKLQSKVKSADGVSSILLSSFTIRGNYRTEDITNDAEVVGKGFLISNSQITEESI
jgi:hypothetical protein